MNSVRWTALFLVILAAFFVGRYLNRPVVVDERMRESAMQKSDGRDSSQALPQTASVSGKRGSVSGGTVGSKSAELPFENALLFDKTSISVDDVQALLSGKRFESKVDEIEIQVASNSDALALTGVYRDAISAQIEKNQLKASLGKIACGVSLCVGYLRGGADAEYLRWTGIFSNDRSTPGYASAFMNVDIGSGNHEYRFVFSTDPTANGASARIK